MAQMQPFMPMIRARLGNQISDQTIYTAMDYVNGFNNVSKRGNHFEFHRDTKYAYQARLEVPEMSNAAVTEIDMEKDISYDLVTENDRLRLANISGISFKYQAMIGGTNPIEDVGTLKELVVSKDARGRTIFTSKLESQNPVIVAAQKALGLDMCRCILIPMGHHIY